MKRFAVEYYRRSGSVLKEVIARETIIAVNMDEARDIAGNRKPTEANEFDIRDVTAIY